MRCGGAAGCRTRQDSKPNDTRQWRSAPESRERREQRLTVGATEPGARIPAGRRLVGAVVAFGDVAEGRRADAVERGVNVAERPAELLVAARDRQRDRSNEARVNRGLSEALAYLGGGGPAGGGRKRARSRLRSC